MSNNELQTPCFRQENAPLVSIVIPVYNVEKYLEECLDSVLKQEYADLEIICIEDCSTDRSPQILQKYASADRRFRIFSQKENGGLGAARNAGLAQATGKYVYFMDSDDMIVPETISQCVRFCEENDLEILAFEADLRIEKGENWTSKYLWDKGLCHRLSNGTDLLDGLIDRKNFLVSVPLRFFRRDFLRQNTLVFPEKIIHEDLYFSVASMLTARRMMLIDRRFYVRRVRSNSIMTAIKKQEDEALKSIYGYWKSILLLQKFANEKGLQPPQCGVLIRLFSKWEQNIRTGLKRLPDECAGKITELTDPSFYLTAMVWKKQPTNAEFARLEKAKRIADRMYDEIKLSNSYRIGRLITWLPRRIKQRVGSAEKTTIHQKG